MLGHVISGYFRLGYVNSGYVRLGQITPVSFSLYQVSSG
jgi:hypothetical protein